MKIIIKARQKLVIPQDLKDYIDAKISKVTNDLKDPSVCEVVLADTRGSKGGIDKVVHISCSVAKIKNPVYATASSEDFFKAVDILEDKFSRALHRAKR